MAGTAGSGSLPVPEEYYRPSRARELRRQAGKLEVFLGLPGVPVAVLPILLIMGEMLILRAVHLSPPLWLWAGIAAVQMGLPEYLLRARVRKLIGRAEALEAEHGARYGAGARQREVKRLLAVLGKRIADLRAKEQNRRALVGVLQSRITDLQASDESPRLIDAPRPGC